MTETTVTQLVAVTDEMHPWTAGMAGTRTYQGAVPLTDANAFLSDHDVQSEPLVWLRPSRPWDDPVRCVTVDGISYCAVSDASRQVLYNGTTDNVHGIPTDGYSIAQPSSLTERAARIVGASDSTPLSVLAVVQLDKHGAEFALTVGTREAITVDGIGAFVPCVVLGTSANGTISNYFAGCSLQVVCYNTQAHALGEAENNGTLFKVKHTRNADTRMDAVESEIRDALGIIEFQAENTAAVMAELANTSVNAEQWSAFVQALTPLTDDSSKNAVTRAEKARAEWSGLFKGGKLGESDNAWTALQAVNTGDIWGITRSTRAGTDPFARATREILTGKRAESETDVYSTLLKVLATV